MTMALTGLAAYSMYTHSLDTLHTHGHPKDMGEGATATLTDVQQTVLAKESYSTLVLYP
jgi:hypothetical protein